MRYWLLIALALLAVAACTAPDAAPPPLQSSAAPTVAPTAARPTATVLPTGSTTPAPAAGAPFATPTATPAFPTAQIETDTLAGLRPLRTIGFGRALQATIAPNGHTLVVATTAGVALFEVPGLRQLRFDPIAGGAAAVVASPDGALLAIEVGPRHAPQAPGTTELRRLSDGAKLAELAGGAPGFSPDGRTLVTVQAATSRHPITRLWRVADGAKLAEISAAAPIFSPDGRYLATLDSRSSDSPIITLRDAAGGRLLEVAARVAAFSHDGQLIALASGGEIQLRRLPDGKIISTLAARTQSPVRVLAFSADARQLHAVAAGALQTWNVADGRLLSQLAVGTLNRVDLSFSHSGNLLAFANMPDSSPTPGYHLIASADGRRLYDDDESVSASFSADDRFAALVSYTGQVRLLNLAGGANAELDLPGFLSVAFSPDAQTLATAGQAVYLWNVTDGALRQSLGAPALAGDSGLLGVERQHTRYSPNGRILTVGGDYDVFEGTIGSATAWDVAPGVARAKLWDIDTGSEGIGNFGLHVGAFSPTAQAAAFTLDGTTVLIRSGDGLTRTLSMTGVSTLEFSPDGALVALGDQHGSLRLVKLADGSIAMRGQAGGPLSGLDFSPDGTLLAARMSAGGAMVWRIGEPAPLVRLATAPDDRALIFTADNRLAIAGGRQGATFYQVSDGRRLFTIPVEVEDLAIGPRRRLLALLHDGQVQLWGVP